MGNEEILTGGGVNEVVRIGNTVRRPTGSWTPRVHELLRQVREKGFIGAPMVHGLTADGLEILDFVPGEVSNYPPTPAARSARALTSAARLLRAYHDSTVDLAAEAAEAAEAVEEGEGWMLPARSPAEVICHGDYAPHNCVLNGEEVVGIIDFDTAHPGPRLWDVAYAVYRWAPLTAPANDSGFGTVQEQGLRARQFCDAYALDAVGRAGLLDMVVMRLHALVDFMREQAQAGSAAFASHVADGHDRLYLADVEHVLGGRAVLERHLLAEAQADAQQ